MDGIEAELLGVSDDPLSDMRKEFCDLLKMRII